MSSRKPITVYPWATITGQAWSGGGTKRILGFYFQSQSEYLYRRGEKADPDREKQLAGRLGDSSKMIQTYCMNMSFSNVHGYPRQLMFLPHFIAGKTEA